MRIVTLLPPELLTHLSDVVGNAHSVDAATDAAELHSLLRSLDAGLLVIDPTVRDGLFAGEIESTVAEFQLIPTVIYTAVSARAMGLVLRLARLGVQNLVLAGVDDEPHVFLALIERLPAYPVIDLMLRALREPMSSLPRSVVCAIELTFKSPSRARTGSDLAALARTTRRSLYRYMGQAGLQPRRLIDCAHLLRAYTMLRAPGGRFKDASTKLGFADPQTLRDLMREASGHSPQSIQANVSPEVFVALLGDYLLRGEPAAELVEK